MHVFHSHRHRLHAPAVYVADGSARPTPESPARIEHLLQALADHPQFTLSPPGPVDPFPALHAIHTADYLDYLRTIHAAWTAEFAADPVAGKDVLPDTFPPPRRPGHPRRPTKPSAQAGYYCFDMAAPITAGTWEAAIASASLAVAAADALLRGQPSAAALCRPPGHHAGPDYCGGFCYLNNAAAAAQHLLLHGHPRVALLDIDYHHGNGTQDIFYARDDVLFLSLHADPNTQYPYFWGYADETGDGPGTGFTVNAPLPRNCSESDWLAAFDALLPRIAAYAPTALVVSVGLDTAHGDAVGDFHLTPAAFSRIGKSLAGLHLPAAFIQEGGYTLANLAPSLLALLAGFEAG